MNDAARNKLKDEILTTLRNSDVMVESFRRQIENKNVIIFVGNTRNGKSTLINYVIGSPLEAFQEGDMLKIRQAQGATSGAAIGQGSLSHTSAPVVFEMKDRANTVVVDAPGFDDNRGALQEITNALYINQIKYSKGVRFVLVSDISNIINDNINGFLSFVETVHTIMPDFDKLKQAVCLIFTKDWKKYKVADIVQLIKNKVLDEDGLRCNKDLIKHFVESPHLVGLFNMPTSAGPVTKEIEVNVQGAIIRSAPLNLNHESDIRFGISTSARIVLLETYLDFFDTVIFAKETFKNFKTSALSKLSQLKKPGLLVVTDRQLQGEKSAEQIMGRFYDYLQSAEYDVTSTSQIPDSLNRLFKEELANVAAALGEIGIRVPADLQPHIASTTIQVMRKKLDYIACIEKVVEKDNKSKDILTCYKDNTRSFCAEIQQIHQDILKEIKTREHLAVKVKCISDISTDLHKVNEQYLFASSKNELLKMKWDLELYLKASRKIAELINERPDLEQRSRQDTTRAFTVHTDVENRIRDINVHLENQKKDEWSSKVSPPLTLVGTLMLYAGVTYAKGFSNMTHLKVIAGSFLFFAAVSWKSVYVRKKFLRLRHRYQQGRLFRSRTCLDNCGKVLVIPRL